MVGAGGVGSAGGRGSGPTRAGRAGRAGAPTPCGAMAAESALHGTRRNRRSFRDCQDPTRGRLFVAELGRRNEPRATRTSRTSRTSRTMRRAKVLKMLAMEQPGASQGAPCAQGGRTGPGAADPVEDFLTTGRTGRRNAMANIMGQHANTGSGDIAQRMDGLAIDQMEAGPSGAGPSGCSETQQATPGAAPEQGR